MIGTENDSECAKCSSLFLPLGLFAVVSPLLRPEPFTSRPTARIQTAAPARVRLGSMRQGCRNALQLAPHTRRRQAIHSSSVVETLGILVTAVQALTREAPGTYIVGGGRRRRASMRARRQDVFITEWIRRGLVEHPGLVLS